MLLPYLRRYGVPAGLVLACLVGLSLFSRETPDDGRARLLARLAVTREAQKDSIARQHAHTDSLSAVSVKQTIRYVTARSRALDAVAALPPVVGDTTPQSIAINDLLIAVRQADTLLAVKDSVIASQATEIRTLTNLSASSDTAIAVLEVPEHRGFFATLKSDLVTVGKVVLIGGAGYLVGRLAP